MPKLCVICIAATTCGLFVGCTDGPFYAMKRANPYFQSQWKKDRQLAPTFQDRLDELDLLQGQLASMDAPKQQDWSSRLEAIIGHDPSPEMRARAVKVVAPLQYESATTALNRASADEVEKVRLAACAAWPLHGGEAARDMLLSLAKTDSSSSVRQAAIAGLGDLGDAEVTSELANLLDDRSPAIQYQVAQSLKSLTGRDYGGDFSAWQRYLEGEDVPEPPPVSVADKVWNALPNWR